MAAQENAVVTACLQYLRLRGVLAWRSNQGAIPGKGGYRRFVGLKGVSDIVGVLPGGRFLGVECKSRTGELSEHQKQFRTEVEARGGLYLCVRSVGELIDALERGGV